MGKVIVVGIGPGGYEDMTIRADEALRACDAIVGYPVYVDLVRDRYPGKELHSTPMTREAERCQLVLELARSGKTAAMVCSGDSGIYGMAALVYELRGESQEPEIQVVPGLTAACSGGAVLGAPLTHDFAVISLSDRLTPWETIERRLDCAAAADLTIALYNPASHGRPDHVKRACDILLREAGGPEAVEAYVRSLGIGGIRIAASEEEMHRGIGNQRVNKARPSSVCTLFDLFLQGRLLKGEYNALLQRLLRGTTTGANKLKAGLPASTVIGHKTGSSDRTAEGIRIADNDVGYVVLPDGRRYCIAVFVTESEENDATNAAIAASASRAAYEYFSSK